MNAPSSSFCPRCQAALPSNAPQGLCPRCLLAGVAEPTLPTVPGTSPLRPPAPSLAEIGAAFPQWEILELLGRGGMGAVYKVRQPNLDRFVALKVLPAAPQPNLEAVFDREWAVTLTTKALTALAAEFSADGKPDIFETLKPWLTGEVAQSQAEAAERLGLSEGAVKVAIHRLRKRYRELVKAEIAETVNDPADAAWELLHLIAALQA
jgi:serine/threonine protein kinase